MDVQDELGGDHTHIIKGKRTKRQRSSAATVTSTSSSAGGGGGAAVSDDYNSAVSSPATTAISSAPSTDCTEEEEDMAICLIMLANGAKPSSDLGNSEKPEKIKKNSEKFQFEASGFYVYECKTCNRTFPSFQALGGHRASHKKPRTATADEKTKLRLTPPKPNSSEEGQSCPRPTKISGLTLTSQASNNNNKSNKIHECSVCGSEFSSGQALGGHMRRHRAVTAVGATAESSNSPVGVSSGNTEETENVDRPMEPRKFLPLDLNLPAPEDDLRESKFQGLVFSATPTLVDCHY